MCVCLYIHIYIYTHAYTPKSSILGGGIPLQSFHFEDPSGNLYGLARWSLKGTFVLETFASRQKRQTEGMVWGTVAAVTPKWSVSMGEMMRSHWILKRVVFGESQTEEHGE